MIPLTKILRTFLLVSSDRPSRAYIQCDHISVTKKKKKNKNAHKL